MYPFGAKTTATPAFGTGSITFGTPVTQAPQFGFGNMSSSTPNIFGTQTTGATSTLNFKPTGFGAPSSTPSSGFGLTTSAPTFSFATTAPTFGTPATSAQTGFAFGRPAASTGLSFGSPAASTGLTFGNPSSTTGPAFGIPASSTGLTFGTPGSTASTTALGFKPTTATFGTPASTSLNFGAGFGTTTISSAAPTIGLNFGTTSTTAAPSLGASFGATTTTPSLGLSFGAPSTVAPSLSFAVPTTGSTALSFGTPTTGLLSGLGGLATSSLPPVTTAPQSVGLGGIALTQSKTGISVTAQKEPPPKEQLLPNEFLQLVEQFKNVVQLEKNRSSDVARCSVKEFRKVEVELDSLNHQFNQVENQLMNNRNLAEQLKYDTAKGLQNIEMAQRTQDTPSNLQYDNAAPLQFFLSLADNFEREMQLLKLKIDNTEKFVKKCNEPNILTSQDLAMGLKRLHETFVTLAGRMQSIHSQVEAQKEVFLSLRKQAVKDNINPFEKMDKHIEAMNFIMKNALKEGPPSLAPGPTPFNSIALGSTNVTLSTQQTQPPPYPTTTSSTLGFGSIFGTPTSNVSPFKPTGFGTSPFQMNSSSNFHLQKPPTGNKRGKQ